jgi:drug/metabolite transporter (DMT)-like permease
MRAIWLTCLAMLAFAGNSLLCRAALQSGATDPASFTAIRLGSGALILFLIWKFQNKASRTLPGDWPSALTLFGYAAGFSFAYVELGAATGALLLFAMVQVTMVGAALLRGERFGLAQSLGFALAIAGLVWLLLPGLAAPPLLGAALMMTAGFAWGLYSLRGKHQSASPLAATAGNFVRSLPFALALVLISAKQLSASSEGVLLAVTSGAIASGLGYAVWYAALPLLRASTAATVQLSVPVIAAAGAVLMLGESLSWRMAGASIAILGGIALVLKKRK